MVTKRLIALLLFFAVPVLMASACSNDVGVSASEGQFDESYLQPLDAAGLTYSVEEVCHYSRQTSNEGWQLQVSLVVDAGLEDAADALGTEIEVILRDRKPMVLQQYEGEPNLGWNGVLESRGGSSVIGVTKNNVTVDGERPPVAWLQVCDLPG